MLFSFINFAILINHLFSQKIFSNYEECCSGVLPMFFPQLTFFVWSISITYTLFYLHSMKNRIFDHLPPHVRPLATLSYPITSLDRSACFHLSISPVPSQLVHLTHLISCPTPLTLPQAHLLPKLPHTWQFLPSPLKPPPPLQPPPNSPSYL